MALTGEQKKIAIDAYYRTVSEGKHLDVFAAVEAVLADQGADLNAKYVQGFEDCRAQAMNVVDEHDGFLQRIEFLKPAPIAEQASAAEQGQATPKRSLSEVLEELCPGVRKRNWPAWAGPYTETDAAPLVTPKMTQDEDDTPAQPPATNFRQTHDWKLKRGWKQFYECSRCLVSDIDPRAELQCTHAAQPPAGDVLERMWRAFSSVMEQDDKGHAEAMAAALSVAQQERDAQWEMAIRHEMPSEFTDLGIDTFVATLRARLAKPAERVTVEHYLKNPNRWVVLLDGANPASSYFYSLKDAERYANGLREEIKGAK